MKHPFWGKVESDWAGFSSDIYFSQPFFDKQEVEVFLGEEYDDEGEEIDDPPTKTRLSEFAETYKYFISNIENCLADLQLKAFERYKKIYAKHYENTRESGKPPLNIDTVEKHNEYIKEIMYLRVLDEKTIKVSIRYALDIEHGVEFRYLDGKIINIGGIAET